MEDFFSRFQAITDISKYSNSEVITPLNIVKDMVDLLPADVFNPDAKFLNPAAKSGRFLAEIYRRLFDSPLLSHMNEADRKEHILKNQLYGLATSAAAAAIVRKQLYDDPTIAGNIVYTADKVSKELIQGAFNIMKFDVVIGNPPYNNDIYLDFVTLGHNLASKYTCMITPAKWQGKSGAKNDSFRKDIVPYMSKIVYFPDTLEVFDSVDSQGGISYFLIDKEIHSQKEVKTICSVQKLFESNGFETCEISKVLYNKQIRSIVNKLGRYKQLKSVNNNYTVSGWYHVGITNIYSEKNCTNKKGTAYVLISPYIQKDAVKYNLDTTFIAVFPTEEQAKSYVSYLNTKFIRFMFLMAKCTLHMQGENAWRFVPDPEVFDHIFTDQELYKNYGLTDEEINIIESVIKERK